MEPITPAQVLQSLLDKKEHGQPMPWWEHAAVAAINRGHYLIIPGRQDTDAYLARYWLTPPKKDEDGYSSSQSIVLHQFIRGDDDGALHNHPYDFVTTILSGGYYEVMGELVIGGHMATEDGIPRSTLLLGPHEKDWTGAFRRVGDQVSKKALEIHMATNPLPETWTMVQTGVRCNDWGFFPQGKPFIPWQKFVKHTTVVGGQARGHS